MTRQEQERKRRLQAKKAAYRKKVRKQLILFIPFFSLIILIIIFGAILLFKTLFHHEDVNLAAIQMPDWIEQDFLTPNPYSRPGTPLLQATGIVVHYTANPGTTAKQNRDYFNGLSETGDTSVSSHFVIGLDGEIIQCIPLTEISYASNQRNVDTVSIECCHPDETGKFTDATYNSLVKLCAWLETQLDLKEKSIIRHYDITGKMCPLYYVRYENQWDGLKSDIKKYRKDNY